MNTVPHLELVAFIEAALLETRADTLVTHHPHDINDDHRQVAVATLAAARLHQRSSATNAPPLKALLHMEVSSATDWQYSSFGDPFNPDTYMEIGRLYLDRKLEAARASTEACCAPTLTRAAPSPSKPSR